MDRHRAAIAWDDEGDPDGNVAHVGRHGLTPAEVETVIRDRRSVARISRSSGRPIVFGWTPTGRFIAVVYEWVGPGPPQIYPITAYEVGP